MTIRVFQGEREMAADNKLLGQFRPHRYPQRAARHAADRGDVRYRCHGIVHVSAKDKGTGQEQQIRIEASGGLSDADIERMVKEAEEHAADDKVLRELVEVRNQAEALIHQTEKNMAEHGDKVEAGDKEAIESAITGLREAIGGEDQRGHQAEGRGAGTGVDEAWRGHVQVRAGVNRCVGRPSQRRWPRRKRRGDRRR